MLWILALLAFLPARAAGPGSAEALKSGAERAFMDVWGAVPAPPAAVERRPQAEERALSDEEKADLRRFFGAMSRQAPSRRDVLPLRGPAALLRLEEVRNANWRTAAVFPLHGKPATAGFTVSRAQAAYLSLLGEGQESPSLVNIMGLLDSSRRVQVNGKSYAVSLSPNIFDKLGSRINVRGDGEGRSFKIRDLIAASYDKGFPVTVNGKALRVFYHDDIVERGGYGVVEPSRRNVTLVRRKGDDFQVYMVFFEQIPANKVAVFALEQDLKLGLQVLEDGKVLGIYTNL